MQNNEYCYKITDGKATLTKYIGSEKCVIIPTEIDGYPVTSLESTFANNYGIKEVTVPTGVKSMILAFDYCRSLEKIKLSKGLTLIDFWCFRECRSLKKLLLPNTVKTVMHGSFEDSGIEKLRIPNTIEDIDGLPPLVKNFKKPLIKGGNLLYVPKDIISYEIPPGVKRISANAFADCPKLENVIIPNTVNEICYQAFKSCSSLCSINLPDSIVKIDMEAFSDCASLEEIILPDSLEVVKSFTFSGCTNLKSVKLPKGLVKIETLAFDKCSSLKNVAIPEGTSIDSFSFDNTLCSLMKE